VVDAERPGIEVAWAQPSVYAGRPAPVPPFFLRDAELAGERLSAIVRLLILTLLALVINSRVDHHHEQFALVTGTAYGVIAAVALMLAWRRIFHPARWKTYEFSRLYP
jgi:di/tricarboxylate transporter